MKNRVALELKRTRKARGWNQMEVANRLGVSQGYVSLLESGKRPVPDRLLPALRSKLGLPPEACPPRELRLNPDRLPNTLAALGYDPFGYLHGQKHNPAEVLLGALRQKNLPARVLEALPWLVLQHPNLEWPWLLERARVHDVQNRLGYVVSVAEELAHTHHNASLAARFRKVLDELEPSRLAREDTLCYESMTESERRWLRDNRPAGARRWNLLTDLVPAHLSYAS